MLEQIQKRKITWSVQLFPRKTTSKLKIIRRRTCCLRHFIFTDLRLIACYQIILKINAHAHVLLSRAEICVVFLDLFKCQPYFFLKKNEYYDFIWQFDTNFERKRPLFQSEWVFLQRVTHQNILLYLPATMSIFLLLENFYAKKDMVFKPC